MTLGGNDALFSQIVQVCLLGIMRPGTSCDAVISAVQNAINDQDFTDRLIQVYDGSVPQLFSLFENIIDSSIRIFNKMPEDNHYQLLQLKYPKLFSERARSPEVRYNRAFTDRFDSRMIIGATLLPFRILIYCPSNQRLHCSFAGISTGWQIF